MMSKCAVSFCFEITHTLLIQQNDSINNRIDFNNIMKQNDLVVARIKQLCFHMFRQNWQKGTYSAVAFLKPRLKCVEG